MSRCDWLSALLSGTGLALVVVGSGSGPFIGLGLLVVAAWILGWSE